jgi:ribosomal protein S20
MANTTSAKKATRKIARRTAVNKARRSRVRGFIRKVEEAIASGDLAVAAEALKAAQPEIQRAASKGVLHSNTASRKVSRLAARVKALSAWSIFKIVSWRSLVWLTGLFVILSGFHMLIRLINIFVSGPWHKISRKIKDLWEVHESSCDFLRAGELPGWVKKIFIFSVNNGRECMSFLNPIDSTAILHECLCDIQITLPESTPAS